VSRRQALGLRRHRPFAVLRRRAALQQRVGSLLAHGQQSELIKTEPGWLLVARGSVSTTTAPTRVKTPGIHNRRKFADLLWPAHLRGLAHESCPAGLCAPLCGVMQTWT